jgi:hypothetical protein
MFDAFADEGSHLQLMDMGPAFSCVTGESKGGMLKM